MEGRPQLLFAALCQAVVVEENGGQLTLVRILTDWTSVGLEPELAPDTVFGLEMALGFFCESEQRRLLSVTRIDPDGSSAVVAEPTLLAFGAGGLSMQQLGLLVDIPARTTGLYTFEVRLDNELFATVPLRVRYVQRTPGLRSRSNGN